MVKNRLETSGDWSTGDSREQNWWLIYVRVVNQEKEPTWGLCRLPVICRAVNCVSALGFFGAVDQAPTRNLKISRWSDRFRWTFYGGNSSATENECSLLTFKTVVLVQTFGCKPADVTPPQPLLCFSFLIISPQILSPLQPSLVIVNFHQQRIWV